MKVRLNEEIKEYCSMLKLKSVKENFEVLMEECEDYEVFLHKLLEKEIEARDERLVEGRIRNAHFPYKKYLEDLDMRALPVAIRQKLPELSTLGFIEKARMLYLQVIQGLVRHT